MERIKYNPPQFIKYDDEYYKIEISKIYRRRNGKDIQLQKLGDTFIDVVLHGDEIREEEYLKQ